MNILSSRIDTLFIVLLTVIRVGAIIFTLPLIGSRFIPSTLKVLLALLLSFSLYPIVKDLQIDLPDSFLMLSIFVIAEMIIGFTIGFAAQLLFVGIRLAGEIISQQMGLSMATILDSQYNYPSSIISSYYYNLSVLLFFSLSIHHWFILIIAESLRIIPISGFNLSKAIGEAIFDFVAKTFIVAIQITAPIMIILLLMTVGIGIIARLVPQMNIFILSLPVNLGTGLLFIVLTLFLFLKEIKIYYYQSIVFLFQIVRLMSQG